MSDVIAKFEAKIARCDGILAKFREELEKNPFHAFSWGRGAMAAAAEKNVAEGCVELLRNGLTVEQLRAHLTERTLNAAQTKAVPHSSSVTSNLMDAYLIEAMATAIEDLRYA